MDKRITMIEDSRESIVKFLKSLPLNENVQLQSISVEPFFNDDIERAIEEFNPGLIILDLRLERDEGSGFRVLRKLKESSSLRDIPVVVCSKYIGEKANDNNKKEAEKYGAVAAFPKTPFPAARVLLSHYKVAQESDPKSATTALDGTSG